ncbi:hypothetical protein BDV40DRAFT_263709 [Aspergillus tamarii]|uniref:Uncharacterized protein n=1 Tax=Aspergillus tamarii TaxID=41984 RepID=A0A5N6UWV6_ASPTM|nr:hypothetical protein BDV40DRAFT_263709 [Aspergillus tamarii]
MTNEPFIFPVTNPDRSWILFKLFHANSTLTKERKLLGGWYGSNRKPQRLIRKEP